MCVDISILVNRYSFLKITDDYFRTNWYLDIHLTQKQFCNEIKYHIYKIRYLAVYVASLKVCNVCYIFPYKQQNATLLQKRCYVYLFNRVNPSNAHVWV